MADAFRLRSRIVKYRGAAFTVREMTYADRVAYVTAKEGGAVGAVELVVMACAERDGAPAFASAEAVRAVPAGLIDKLAGAILELSSDEAEDEEKNA